MSKLLGRGTKAPDFTLPVTPDQDLSLADLSGRPVLWFYSADWSPVCGDQVTLYNEILSEFHKHEAELLGISASREDPLARPATAIRAGRKAHLLLSHGQLSVVSGILEPESSSKACPLAHNIR